MRLHHLTVYVHSAMAILGALWAALQTFGLSPLFFRLSTSGRRSEPERHIDPGTTRCSHTRLPAPLCDFRSSLSPCTRAMRYLHAAHDRPAPPHTMTIRCGTAHKVNLCHARGWHLPDYAYPPPRIYTSRVHMHTHLVDVHS